jgi:signal peptidase II
MKRKTQIALLVFMAAIVGLDQLTKYLTVRGIPMGEQVPLIPGVIHLTYVRNTGAAFSLFSGMRWLFLLLVVVFFAAPVLLIRRGVVTRTAELWSLAAIGGGALGNAIDRLLYGSVIDMIEPEFIDFAVFNVADSFITCGAVVLVIFLLFFDRKKKSA